MSTTLSAGDLRKHALALVRRTVRSGKFSDADVARWSKELGADVVAEIVKECAPNPPSKASKKKAASTEE